MPSHENTTGAGRTAWTWFLLEELVELATIISWIFLNFEKIVPFFQPLYAANVLILGRLQANLNTPHISKHTVLGRKIADLEMSSFECNTFENLQFRYYKRPFVWQIPASPIQIPYLLGSKTRTSSAPKLNPQRMPSHGNTMESQIQSFPEQVRRQETERRHPNRSRARGNLGHLILTSKMRVGCEALSSL